MKSKKSSQSYLKYGRCGSNALAKNGVDALRRRLIEIHYKFLEHPPV
jgi:hypothetical protein